MGRKLKTHLDQLRPDLASTVYSRQQSQKKSHDKHNGERTFIANDPVLVKNYHNGPSWLPGEVLTSGPRNYKVKLSNGTIVRRHVDQMRKRPADVSTQHDSDTDFEDFQSSNQNSASTELSQSTENSSPEPTVTLRRSSCDRRPPDRFSPASS